MEHWVFRVHCGAIAQIGKEEKGMSDLIEDHEFIECPCESCGECVFEIAPEKKPPDRYCRKYRQQHARIMSKKEWDAYVYGEGGLMSDTRIKVPEEMLAASIEAVCGSIPVAETTILQHRAAIKAALLWQKEHPPVPTDKQAEGIYGMLFDSEGLHRGETTRQICKQWIECMYDEPEPEVPGYIASLLAKPDFPHSEEINRCILTAHYRTLEECQKVGSK